MKENISRFTFGLALSLLITLNAAQFLNPTSAPVDAAGINIPGLICSGHAVYDSTHKFIGCVDGPPYNCILIQLPSTSISISGAGVHLDDVPMTD